MKKLSNDELGTLITREMMSMMTDSTLSYEQRARLFCAITSNEVIEDGMMSAFANSLKVGFKLINDKRIKKIESDRERKKEYAKNRHPLTDIDNDRHPLTDIDNDRHPLTDIDNDRHAFPYKAKHSIAKHNILIPPNPQGGEERIPDAISADDLIGINGTGDANVDLVVAEIEQTYPYKANGRKLRRCVASILKKNTPDEILVGFRKHVEAWKADGWQFAPGRITEWLYDRKYLDPVREKKAAPEEKAAPGCGSCGVEIA